MLPHGASSETAVSENHQQPTPPVPTPRPSSASPAVAAASLVKQSEAIRKDSSAQTPATNAPTGAPAAPTFHTPDVGAGFSPALGTAPTSGVLGPDATWKPADAGDLSSLANGTHPRGKYEIDPGRSVTRNAPTQGINGTVTPWQSLATMGLGMMTGNSRNFLTNLGAGAQAGIKEYSRELAGANKQADIDFTQRQKQQRDAQQVARGNADSRYHSDSLDNTVANEAALRQAEKDRLAQSGQQWQQDYGLRSAQAGRTATQFAQEQANQALNPPGSYSKQTGPADANGNVPYTLYDSKDVPVRSYYQAGENTRGGLSLEDANTEAGKLVQNGAIPPKQFDAKVQELMGGQKPPSSPGAPVSISNKAQYDALPRGTKYTAPDGSQRVKP